MPEAESGLMEKTVSGIYLVTEPCSDLLERVEIALQRGVGIVQYREKDPSAKDRLVTACRLRVRCRKHRALFIVNDDPLLALKCEADGVHLGQGDRSPAAAREMLGEGALIGVSTHCLDEAVAAERDGADYIGFGCLFPTRTKGDTTPASLEELARVRKAVSIPVVAIGGIDASNLASAIRAGADSAAVISAIMQAKHCRAAVNELLRQYRLGKAI